jgi:hypothetical protein
MDENLCRPFWDQLDVLNRILLPLEEPYLQFTFGKAQFYDRLCCWTRSALHPRRDPSGSGRTRRRPSPLEVQALRYARVSRKPAAYPDLNVAISAKFKHSNFGAGVLS